MRNPIFLASIAITTCIIPACLNQDPPPTITCTSHLEGPLPTTPCKGSAGPDDVCIAGGEFTMGHCPIPYSLPVCPKGETCGPGDPPPNDFGPPHRVKLSPFFIDRYPATNAQYKECYDAGVCPPDCKMEKQCSGGMFDETSFMDPLIADFPASLISVEGAEAYCRWKGKRLPTEAEWERAARGPQGFDYPWGNEAPDCTHYVCNPMDKPASWSYYYFPPVGANPGDVSPEGVHDMVTGTLQILFDYFDPHYYDSSPYENPPGPSRKFQTYRAIRGNFYNYHSGSFVYNGVSSPLPAWARTGDGYANFLGGVRCARSDEGVAPPKHPTPWPTLIDGVFPSIIKLDVQRIYFYAHNRDTIESALVDGTDVHEVANGLQHMADFVIDPDNLYAAMRGTYNASDGAIVRIPKNGGTPEILASALAEPEQIAIADGFLYWVNRGIPDYQLNTGDGTVMRMPTTGGPPEILATNQIAPNSFVLLDGFVYWANQGTIDDFQGTPNGSIARVPMNGGATEVIADAQSMALNLIHGKELLWLVVRDWNNQSGQIVALRNGQVTPLGKEQQGVGAMAEYGGTIVWRIFDKLVAIDSATGEVTATWPNDACGVAWNPIWIGAEGVFWGCRGNEVEPGEMRFMKPW